MNCHYLGNVQYNLGEHPLQAELAIQYAAARRRALGLWLWSVWLAAA